MGAQPTSPPIGDPLPPGAVRAPKKFKHRHDTKPLPARADLGRIVRVKHSIYVGEDQRPKQKAMRYSEPDESESEIPTPTAIPLDPDIEDSLAHIELPDPLPVDPRIPTPPPSKPTRPMRVGESWGELLARIGDEFHGNVGLQSADGTIEDAAISRKEAIIREAVRQAIAGNPAIMREVLRRMPHPRTGLAEGDPPQVVQVGDWKTEAVRLIMQGRLAWEVAVSVFGVPVAQELFNAANSQLQIESPNGPIPQTPIPMNTRAVGPVRYEPINSNPVIIDNVRPKDSDK